MLSTVKGNIIFQALSLSESQTCVHSLLNLFNKISKSCIEELQRILKVLFQYFTFI